MKPAKHSFAAQFPLLLALILLAGCASTGMDRSDKASTTMQTVENDIKLIAAQLDATGTSLDNLVIPGQSDVKKAFDTFTDNVASIEKMESSFAAHADEMQARGKDYFEEWKKEGDAYKNSDIQELSEQRRVELAAIYGRIAGSSIGVKAAFRTYVSDLKEIQTYLSTDLTPKGIETITPISRKVVSDGVNLKFEIQNVQSSIETAKSAMSHSGA
jgi:hypothetical protein